MKKIHPTKVIDLRFQVDHVNSKKVPLLGKYRGAAKNARLVMIIIRQREIKVISDGNKITENTVI